MVTETLPDKLLRDIPLFHGLNPTERRQMAEISRLKEFKPGETVLKQGETSRDLWIVVEGKCEVVKQAVKKKAEPVVLAVLEPYSQFGEMSFFHPAPHSADVRAKTAVKLLRIAHVDYQDLMDEGVTAACKLAHNAVESLAERLRRMDDWIAELLAHEPTSAAAKATEWSIFRDKLFNRWSL